MHMYIYLHIKLYIYNPINLTLENLSSKALTFLVDFELVLLYALSFQLYLTSLRFFIFNLTTYLSI